MAKWGSAVAELDGAQFEFRVWGSHRRARKRLDRLALDVTNEQFDDCYFLVDDPSWNAKVRDDTLKVKRLVSEHRGFERWISGRIASAAGAPSPFDLLFEELRLDRPQRGKSFDLRKAVDLLGPSLEVQAVFVSKSRRRFRLRSARAEVTELEVEGAASPLRSVSIEGDDLDELVALRKKLGLKGQPNVAVHQAIESVWRSA